MVSEIQWFYGFRWFGDTPPKLAKVEQYDICEKNDKVVVPSAAVFEIQGDFENTII